MGLFHFDDELKRVSRAMPFSPEIRNRNVFTARRNPEQKATSALLVALNFKYAAGFPVFSIFSSLIP